MYNYLPRQAYPIIKIYKTVKFALRPRYFFFTVRGFINQYYEWWGL